jgi:hypothetical protein
MLFYQRFYIVGGFKANASCSISMLNLLPPDQFMLCFPYFLNHLPLPAAAARGATTIHKLMVISMEST